MSCVEMGLGMIDAIKQFDEERNEGKDTAHFEYKLVSSPSQTCHKWHERKLK
jgi:hypothetical protein